MFLEDVKSPTETVMCSQLGPLGWASATGGHYSNTEYRSMVSIIRDNDRISRLDLFPRSQVASLYKERGCFNCAKVYYYFPSPRRVVDIV